jgi:hypothetical protein
MVAMIIARVSLETALGSRTKVPDALYGSSPRKSRGQVRMTLWNQKLTLENWVIAFIPQLKCNRICVSYVYNNAPQRSHPCPHKLLTDVFIE